jgi:hypothetical protein
MKDKKMKRMAVLCVLLHITVFILCVWLYAGIYM